MLPIEEQKSGLHTTYSLKPYKEEETPIKYLKYWKEF